MNVIAALNALLKTPELVIERTDRRNEQAAALLAGALLCYAAYAVAAGFFQGGSSIALAVMKIPLIILSSIALCLPSLYVFTALAGADLPAQSFVTAVAGFCAIAGLILIGLMPVIWLFSVSSISLMFVVWMHLMIWIIALAFARRLLLRMAGAARTAVGLWLILLFVVSLQMTTYLRPVLWRDTGAPLIELEKKSFFSHFWDVGASKP